MAVQEVVQPGSRGPFLQVQRQSSMQFWDELHNRRRFGLQQAFHNQHSLGV
jgi:hypothetical protein